MQAIVSNGNLAEFVCDTKGRIVSANEAGSCLVGIPIAELVGRGLPDLVAEASRAEQVELVERMLRGELNYADARVRTAHHEGADGADESDEKADPTAVRLAVVRNAQAQPRAIVAVAHQLPTP